jgi:N-acetylmuramoyl-L-alanine amidase
VLVAAREPYEETIRVTWHSDSFQYRLALGVTLGVCQLAMLVAAAAQPMAALCEHKCRVHGTAGASGRRALIEKHWHRRIDPASLGEFRAQPQLPFLVSAPGKDAPVLAHELGIETMLTRDKDVLVPLDERAARANAFHADLFVSIHCNASESGEARGIEVFMLDPSKDASRATSRVAALENGWLGKKALDATSLDAEMARILKRLGSGETSAASRVLGELLARSSMASLSPRYPDLVDHGLKSAAFTVLAGAEMPAVLFETSFISNPEDESRLGKAGYRQKIADAIVNAVRAYREGR